MACWGRKTNLGREGGGLLGREMACSGGERRWLAGVGRELTCWSSLVHWLSWEWID